MVILEILSVLTFVGIVILGIYSMLVAFSIQKGYKYSILPNMPYVAYKNMIFKSGFELEDYLYKYINNNPGLGNDYFIREFESSEIVYGIIVKDLVEKEGYILQ